MGFDADTPQIQEAFLVHKSGCLITYSSAEGEADEDFDILAGMLTAIQSFVKDAFGAGQWSLKRLEFEDRNLLIELGEHLYLAVIYGGKADTKMQSKVERTVDIIEEKFWEQCKEWTGDMEEWEGIKEIIRPLFIIEEDVEDDRARCDLCGAVIEELDIVCPVCGYDSSMFN